ncbi:MAG: polysaccharide biosynthesis protein [Coriobacteriales bacterium]|jgi:FlaA1/EpsC-like NDP-sugar epimerase|nr:polysaccharide biosynthesis protein [Coriobacteriales bacterium]
MNFKLTGRGVFLVFWDVAVTYLAFTLSSIGTQQAESILVSTDVLFIFGILAIINVATFLAFRLYNTLWEYASINELLQLLYATILSTFVGAMIHFIAGVGVRLPIRVYFVAWVLLFLFTGTARFLFRYYRHGKSIAEKRPPVTARKRTLIVGAGETGSLTIKRMTQGDYAMQGLPIAALDDDSQKTGQRIHGVKVVGQTDKLLEIVERFQIEQIVVAIPSADATDRKRIYDLCIQTNCHLLTLPNVRDLRMDELDNVRLREVELTDLLSREEVVFNTRLVSGYLADKCVLITGGGGSIGSELARQVCAIAPRQLLIFDIYENTAYELQMELQEQYDDIDIRVEIGSIRDVKRLGELFATYQPDVVFHAAAHKHVPLMESCPEEAVRNNVLGTLNVAQAAHLQGTRNFIFISTDKAVNPTSVMGATKRMGEMIVQQFAQTSQTCFTAVRFGNVLGSHGSAIPLFTRQIAAGGPVTITHPDITRYFMTIPEAARLVVQAGGMAHGGEIFILDMGEPVKIVDLAYKLIRLSGRTPEVDIAIQYVGLRPGEKLYEELLMDTEETRTTSVKGIMISAGEAPSAEDVRVKLENLSASLGSDSETIRQCLAAQVPTYHPKEH